MKCEDQDDGGILSAFGVRRNSDPFTWTLQFSNSNGGGALINPYQVDLFKVPASYPLIITNVALHSYNAAAALAFATITLLRNGQMHSVMKDCTMKNTGMTGANHKGTDVLRFNGKRSGNLNMNSQTTGSAYNAGKFPAYYYYRPGDQVSAKIDFSVLLPPIGETEMIMLGGFILR